MSSYYLQKYGLYQQKTRHPPHKSTQKRISFRLESNVIRLQMHKLRLHQYAPWKYQIEKYTDIPIHTNNIL